MTTIGLWMQLNVLASAEPRALFNGPAKSERALGAHTLAIFVADTVALACALVGSEFVRFGSDASSVTIRAIGLRLSYIVLSLIIVLFWLLALSLVDSRNQFIMGFGIEEYRRVFSASLYVCGGLAIVAYALQSR
jgi:hypothetical protein